MAKILVVDDDTQLLRMFSQMLADSPHEVQTCESAEAALSCVQDTRFDLVICDIVLPGLDGVTLMENLLETHPEIKLIAITGGQASMPEGSAFKIKDSDILDKVRILRKPIELQFFLAAVEASLSD